MKLITIIYILLFALPASASHIVGGDIYYDYLGNNSYKFYISIYRDCNSTGAQFDNPLNLTIYSGNGLFVQNVEVPFPGSDLVPVVFNNPCVTPPTNICTENAIYTTIVVLPPTASGYTISYQRCCRGPNITNIMNPGDTGFTLSCQIPGTANSNYINSSPRFNNYPPLLLCNNEDLIFDHSATDPDGDLLQYQLVTPNSGASGLNPQPTTAPPPPYAPIFWVGGHTAAQPLGPGSTINIDPNTGLLTASPNLLGLYVVGIRVSEFRNGVEINSITRDFLFRVFNCNLQLESILPNQEDLPDFVSYCQGLTVNFVNNSYGGTNYEWDFGVPGTNTDVSTAFEPSFTYPTDGFYQAMLVVNPGWPCTDTAYMDINVNNEIIVDFTSQDSLCIFGNNFNFVANSNGPAGSNYSWDFGPNANISTATGQTVNNVQFDATGNIPVTVFVENNLCVADYTGSVYIFPEPTAEMVLSPTIECDGLTVDFGNNSSNSNFFAWDFGVPGTVTDVSTAATPIFTYNTPGTYTITLISGSSPLCADTVMETVSVNDPILIDFTSEDSLCITDNSFNFDGTVSGPPETVYTWDFGSNASISSSNDIDVSNVVFSQTGSIPISLIGAHNDCIDTVIHDIYIFQAPTIDFYLKPGLQCAPFNAEFINLSTAETPITYLWDFGDGFGSNDQHPTHLYPIVGNYHVTLTISTDHGCIDTLTLLKPDLVTVRPNPTAGFNLSTDFTDICNSSIEFFDESIGANEWFYWFDDSSFISNEQSPTHTYISDGTHYPMQIVTNQYGCKDTTYSSLYIEPFTIYAPNTFTPDGNEFNNDFLPIIYLPLESYKMQIFDRWGELVFETVDINEAWDGTSINGQMAQDGTYIWKLTFVSCEPINPEIIETGHVTLLR
ncbi:MAG: PKD domain-containing protein [Crocinitomicaceae bacterium]|nr:PKD domain-containing protein [Crocinitomicaceae bacterium]